MKIIQTLIKLAKTKNQQAQAKQREQEREQERDNRTAKKVAPKKPT